jgi:hypothetical protein
VEWYPHPGPQITFCKSGEFEVLFGGAAGPGKTDCLIMEATRHVKFPDYRGIIFRRTYPQLQEIIDRCWKWYPKLGGEYRAGEHRWTFPSGAKIALSHMQHEQNKYDHQGKEYHFVGFDELTQFLESQYLYLHSRIRTTNPEIPKRVRATTNPGGIGHMWTKKRFVDIAKPGQVYIDPHTGFSRRFIPAKVTDNPTLIDNDPLYVAQLEALPEIEKMRLLHGVWDVFEGQVFAELGQRTHGCDSFEIPHEWDKFMAFDWGYAKPWCALWFAVDFDGVIYLYRELYGCKEGSQDVGLRQTNTEIAMAILNAEREKVRARVADPACWSPTKIRGSNQVHGPSFIEDAAKMGLFFLKADNDRLRGKQQCHQRFAMEAETDINGEVVNEHPRFVAFNDCKHWWRTMMMLREDPKRPEDVDTDQEDHMYDTTRYAFMSRPIIPKKVSKAPPGSFMAERNKYINAKKYARRHGVSLAAAYSRVR